MRPLSRRAGAPGASASMCVQTGSPIVLRIQPLRPPALPVSHTAVLPPTLYPPLPAISRPTPSLYTSVKTPPSRANLDPPPPPHAPLRSTTDTPPPPSPTPPEPGSNPHTLTLFGSANHSVSPNKTAPATHAPTAPVARSSAATTFLPTPGSSATPRFPAPESPPNEHDSASGNTPPPGSRTPWNTSATTPNTTGTHPPRETQARENSPAASHAAAPPPGQTVQLWAY